MSKTYRPVTEKEAKALYFISKTAKEYRDFRRNFRNKLKEYLFEHKLPDFAQEEVDMLKGFGIEKPCYFETEYDSYEFFEDIPAFKMNDSRDAISYYYFGG